MVDLSARELRERFSYNEKTGVLSYKKQVGRFVPGDKSGCIDRIGNYSTVKVFINGKSYLAHRVIWKLMTGKNPIEIDHINGNPIDNRWSNLRNVSSRENALNMARFCTNKSGISGVVFSNERKKWQSYIYDDYKKIKLYWGYDFFEACCRRRSAEIKYRYHNNHGRRERWSE